MCEPSTSANRYATFIERRGRKLTYTPPPGSVNLGVQSREISFLIEVPSASDIQNARFEAGLNASNGMATIFTSAGDSGVLEEGEILYEGFTYRIVNAPKQPYGDEFLNVRALGIRSMEGRR